MHVLLVEDNPGDAEIIRHSMSAFSGEWRVTHVGSLSDAVKSVTSDNDFDVVLLDLTLPDSNGYETFVEFNQVDSHTPVVVFSDLEDHNVAIDAVRAGAQDFLFKSATEPHRVLRSLRYAVERNAITHRNDSYQRAPEAVSAPAEASRDSAPLSQRNNKCYEEAVSIFKQIVELSLDSRAFKVDHRISDRLALLAELLAREAAEPADAYAVHQDVVTSLSRNLESPRTDAITKESRLMLTGLLSKLASYYRNLWLGQNQPSPVAGECNGEGEAKG